jgi:hypothetical protein
MPATPLQGPATQRGEYQLFLGQSSLVGLHEGRVCLSVAGEDNAWQVVLCAPGLSELYIFGFTPRRPTPDELGRWISRALAMFDTTEPEPPDTLCVNEGIPADYPCIGIIAEAAGKALQVRPDSEAFSACGERTDECLLTLVADSATAGLCEVVPAELWLPDGLDAMLGAAIPDSMLERYLRGTMVQRHARYLRQIQRHLSTSARTEPSQGCRVPVRSRTGSNVRCCLAGFSAEKQFRDGQMLS